MSTDTLKLTDLNSSDVTLSRDGYNAFVNVIATGQTIQIDNQFYDADREGYGVEQISFADGTSWNRQEIDNRTSGGITVVGGIDENIEATDLADTFYITPGIGDTTVTGFQSVGINHDYLQFSRTVFSDWAHLLGATQQLGSDLIITLDDSDYIRLANVAPVDFTSKNIKFIN